MINQIKAALFGLAIGDALGVPVEFKSRENLQRSPVTGITGYGSWNQPPGTWSDDSSLAFCLRPGSCLHEPFLILLIQFVKTRTEAEALTGYHSSSLSQRGFRKHFF